MKKNSLIPTKDNAVKTVVAAGAGIGTTFVLNYIVNNSAKLKAILETRNGQIGQAAIAGIVHAMIANDNSLAGRAGQFATFTLVMQAVGKLLNNAGEEIPEDAGTTQGLRGIASVMKKAMTSPGNYRKSYGTIQGARRSRKSRSRGMGAVLLPEHIGNGLGMQTQNIWANAARA